MKRTLSNITKSGIPRSFPDNRLVLPDWYVGIEIEIEGTNRDFSNGLIRTVDDGSLRGGKEYITEPLYGSALLSSIFCLEKELREASVTERCSVHVHLNVGPLSIFQLKKLLVLYYCLEEVLFDSICKTRKQNNNCYMISYSDTVLSFVTEFLMSDKIRQFTMWPKYCAVNLAHIFDYGTIEFRMFPGSIHAKDWISYVNIVLALLKASFLIKNIKNLKQVRRAITQFLYYLKQYESKDFYHKFKCSMNYTEIELRYYDLMNRIGAL